MPSGARRSLKFRLIGLGSSFVVFLGSTMSCGMLVVLKDKAVDEAEKSVVKFATKKIQKFIQDQVAKLALKYVGPAGKVELALRIYKGVMIAGKVVGKALAEGNGTNHLNAMVLPGPAAKPKTDVSCKEVTPALLTAQLWAESSFNPKAVSSANANGIAQFLPTTWDAYAVDGDGDGDRDIWDVDDAIPSAVSYDCSLARSLRDIPGDPIDNMLAAFNAGPDAVRQYRGVPPYAQTKDYVRKIRRKMELFVDDDPQTASTLGSEIVRLADEQVRRGVPYVYGAEGPNEGGGYDCSSLVLYAVNTARKRLKLPAISIGRTTGDQYASEALAFVMKSAKRPLQPADLRPGDLIYLWPSGTGRTGNPEHVVIYAGNGETVEAANPRSGLRRAKLTNLFQGYWAMDMAVKRVP